MKPKISKNRPCSKLLTPNEIITTDNQFPDHSNSMNESDDTCNSDYTKKVRKLKRKACLTSQDDNSCMEQLQSEQKCKTKKKNADEEEEIDFDSLIEKQMSGESDEGAKKQDNTPESLKKRKKLKKKKNKTNLINAQPNNSTLDYLRVWKSDRSHWKFEKNKQTRLVSNMLDDKNLPDEYFSIFLEYMEGGSKSIKELMSKLANEVVDEMEKWESLNDVEKENTPKVNENKYKRARTVLQMFQ